MNYGDIGPNYEYMVPDYRETNMQSTKQYNESFARAERNTMFPIDIDLTEDNPFGPQPAKATVTIEGGLERWHELYLWLNNRFVNVDFDYRKNKVVFHCYPFAVND